MEIIVECYNAIKDNFEFGVDNYVYEKEKKIKRTLMKQILFKQYVLLYAQKIAK